MVARPSVPAPLRRRILVEAGHRCAIPTCRNIEVHVHHIVPWAKCQAHRYENLIALCANCHGRADRGKIDRKSLRLYKINLRFAHDKFSQTEMDLLFELLPLEKGVGILWLPAMLVLLKRLIAARYIDVVRSAGAAFDVGGMRITPDTVLLTEKGRDFLNELGTAEL